MYPGDRLDCSHPTLPVEVRHVCLTDSEVEILVNIVLWNLRKLTECLGVGQGKSLEQSQGTTQKNFFNLLHLPNERLLIVFDFLVWKYFTEKQKSKDARKVPNRLSSPTGNDTDIEQWNALSLPASGYALGQVSSWSCYCVSVRKETYTITTLYFLTSQNPRQKSKCDSLPTSAVAQWHFVF